MSVGAYTRGEVLGASLRSKPTEFPPGPKQLDFLRVVMAKRPNVRGADRDKMKESEFSLTT